MSDTASTGLQTALPKGFEAALDTQRDAEAVAKLKAACEAAYDKHTDSCSHAVNAIIRAMMGLDETSWPQRQANVMVDFFNGSADWTVVTLDRGYELAQQGVVVVGGAKAAGNGHVVVIYPGKKQPRGGYTATNKAGETYTVSRKGEFPLVLSASLGSWPGAKSRGTKTVWDPWGKDDAFAEVVFWAPAKAVSGKPDISGSLRKFGGGLRYA